MVSVTENWEPRRRNSESPAAFMVAGDRASAFARARRHSLLVKALRITLPILAVLMLGSYGLFVQRSFKIAGGELTLGPASISTENLTMHNPRYEGFSKDGSKYILTARSATQDLTRQQAPITLGEIEGRLLQPKNTVLLTSPRGAFDSKAHILELYDRVDIKSDDGMTARLTRATVYAKDGKIVSTEPVQVEMAAGVLHGNEMVLLQKAREVTFDKGVTARLLPQQKPKPAEAQPRAPAAPGLLTASDQPIDVASPTLKIDDNAKTAVFSGDVKARQGPATLAARELEVFYEGSPVAQEAAAPGGANGRVKRLVARTGVVITQGADQATSNDAEFDAQNERAVLKGNVVIDSGPERRATADRADLDSRANTALLTGSVVVKQGRNTLSGRRLFIDRKAATTQLSAPGENGQPQGRITARFYQAEAENRTKTSAAKALLTPAAQGAGLTFRTDPSAPIDVEADVLDVSDTVKTAIFRGDAVATQGDFTVRTMELVATYSGQAGLALGEAPAGGAAANPAAQLQRIQARGKVVVTSKDNQSATGDWADFDMKSNTVVLGGDVVMSQGRNVVRGPKLVIDMTTGQSRMETAARVPGVPAEAPAKAAEGAKPAGPPAPGLPGNGACGGRMCAVFYPQDAQAMAKKGVDTAKEIAKEAAKDLAKGDAGQGKPAPPRKREGGEGGAASSWNSSTIPAGPN